MSVFILVVRRTQFKVDGSLIQDFSNYYISKKQIRRYYFAASLAVFAVLILLPLLLNRLITPLYYAVNPILLLDMSLVFLPSL